MGVKFILRIGIVFFPLFINAQVGINTSTPTRTLHVVGDLRIRQLNDESDKADYDRILVQDQDGNIDYTTKSNLLPTGSDPDEANKEAYSQLFNEITENGNPSKILKCGKFYFLFDSGSDSRIKFRLVDEPASSVDIFMSMEQNWDGNGFQFFQGHASNDSAATPFVFTPENYNVPQEFAEANVADSEQNVMHFQYPDDPNFYRLTIYRVRQKVGIPTVLSWDFAATCEKF
ncbi:hypothetical protein [Epilithonimonas sp.]|uniref:hypothetical protein n=1 Tax=Epilithonimonas sp. TaxID=2894511 RepID=UPI0028A0318B|nr:hypothetical protein [Epilithonimonas sp.]